MKRFPLFLVLGLLAAASIFQSCQKDDLKVANPTAPSAPSSDRAPEVYGVSVFTGGAPSLLHTMDAATGFVTNSVQVHIFNSSGVQVFINDLKGVCVVNGQVWVSTGFNAVDAYSNMLLKVNPSTGFATVIAHSTIGTVSDIDYDPATDMVYGLANNTNRLVSIDNAFNYVDLGLISNMGNHTSRGLALVGDANGSRIVVAGSRNAGSIGGVLSTRLFNVSPVTVAAVLIASITPDNQLATAHCGIGYDMDHGVMVINRRGSAGFGLNSFVWSNPLPNPTASAFWGGTGINFEDLSSDIQ